MDDSLSFQCELCGKSVKKKSNLYQHMRLVHKTDPCAGKITCPIENCDQCVSTYNRLREHIENIHRKALMKEEHVFSNITEFNTWKESMEKENKASYVVEVKRTLKDGSRKTFWKCHRSGAYKSVATQRASKKGGSVKMGACCPSYIEATEASNKVEVMFFSTHVGHTPELKYLSLSQSEKQELQITPDKRMKIHWNGDVPHFRIGRRVYACHQGKDKNLYQKKRYAEKRDSKGCMDDDLTKRRKLAQPTKKLDCPVVINISRVLAMPRYKVSTLTHWEKVKMAATIKEKLQNGEEIVGENIYSFKLPDDASHQNHTVGLNAAATETIDPKVRSKIKELVFQGKHNISIITALLEQYVVNELGETDKLRGRFYPNRQCIRNIVNAVKREIGCSNIDQENTDQPVKGGEEKCELSIIYSQPCTLQQNSSEVYTELKSMHEDDLMCSQPNEYEQLASRKSKRIQLINECNSSIRLLLSTMRLLEEHHLVKLKSELQMLCKEATSHVTLDQETPLSAGTPPYIEHLKPRKKKVKRLAKQSMRK